MQKLCIVLLSGLLCASCSNTNKTDKPYYVSAPIEGKADSVKNDVTQEVQRVVTRSVITRVIDVNQFPLEIQEEFSNENQKLVLELRNVRKTKISGRIIPESGQDNIRFNNIELNRQSIDGPFGKDFEYELDQTGDYSIVIQKSLMASGRQTGKFKVILK